jgi:mono/diheme cytochrome c family protein
MRTHSRLAVLGAAAGLGALVACAALPPEAGAPVPGAKKVIHGSPPLEYVGLKNPLTSADPKSLPGTDPNIQSGKTLYERHCAACHGVRTTGDGPEAVGYLTPISPADLTDPEAIATLDQAYVFWRISEGGREAPFLSAMPTWKDELTEEQVWQVVLYIYKAAGVSPKGTK